MKQEDYVTLEVAKLLKEKGYNEPSEYYYRKDNGQFMEADGYLCNCYNYNVVECTANPLAEVAKWFREKHNLVIAVSPTYYDFDGNIVGLKYTYTIFPITNEEVFQKSVEEDLDIPYKLYNSYEEALNEGIKVALNKI